MNTENTESAPTRPKRRRFAKTTRTWQLFEELFLKTHPDKYPLTYGPYTKGQALNLSIGMNTCHVQHREETGMPDENMLYSAKPVQVNEEWFVEISTNYTRTGAVRPSRQKAGHDWMQGLLAQVRSEESGLHNPSAPREPEVDQQEALLERFMKGEK